MGGILFNEIVFGPIKSRRLGISLGINLLPTDSKYCTFNCVYCECGWNRKAEGKPILPTRKQVAEALENKLSLYADVADEEKPNSITYAGNGEPTIHPEFSGIVEDTVRLRNKYLPEAKITVLSNATLIKREEIFDALSMVDNNVLKLDAGTEEMCRRINQPGDSFDFNRMLFLLKKFHGNCIVQTLFLKGSYNGREIDNTTDEEVELWLELLKEIKPKSVMIYPIDRETPAHDLEKIDQATLEAIAKRVESLGIKALVYA
ncbi:MAG: radical SAM protein [Bacteroidales bacterium]